MSQPESDFYRYWGKSKKNPQPGDVPYHLLVWHSLDVAACGYMMVKENFYGLADILTELDLTGDDAADWIAWLFACHDIGKFARDFQQLASHPDSPLVRPVSGPHSSLRHDSLGYHLWQNIFLAWCDDKKTLFPDCLPATREDFGMALDIWMAISAGHHGEPPIKDSGRCSSSFEDEDITAASLFITALCSLFTIKKLPQAWLDKNWRKKLKKLSWSLAGIVVLADWLGSDEHLFPFRREPLPLRDYWTETCLKARFALSQLPACSTVSHYTSPQALFPFIQQLTPLQKAAATLEIGYPGPQLFIFEDVTGAGKTEAALILTHRLLSATQGQGMYVGLPTMATANAMYHRLGKAYRALFTAKSRPSLVLAHGGRKMSAEFSDSVWRPENNRQYDEQTDISASGECHQWFAGSAKKALLAEVGVGTLDQLLMAVMPFRHQSLRLAGIRKKILLLDEVHAYDSYMVRLLEGLLRFHAASGGCAIILSATLPSDLRKKLQTAFSDGAGFSVSHPDPDAGYPWLTHLSSAGLREQSLGTRPEVKRRVAIVWLNSDEDAKKIICDAIAAGRSLCWVRNTVDDAIGTFQHLVEEQVIPPENILLFHSRFIFRDRMEIEEKTLAWFGKASSADKRQGRVLIATQVIEQSLDLDFDCMISDLAPIDLLIQRAGRLQRHLRDKDGNAKTTLPDERPAPVLCVLAPEWQEQAEPGWLGEALKGTGYVYPDQARLWLTQALLRKYGQIRMPEDARALINGVYEPTLAPPAGLQTLSDEVYANMLSQRAVASQNLLKPDKGYDRESSDFLWDDGREFSTRLGEQSVDVFLAWLDSHGQLQPVSDSDFPWEKSRVQVRQSWWNKHAGNFQLPEPAQLEHFRQQQRRNNVQVVLVSEAGEADYYSRRQGLTGQKNA